MQSLNILLDKEYKATADKIFGLFEDLTVFKLTGADVIDCDMVENGTFSLIFNERGIIYGRFIELIRNSKITMQWNIEGFAMPTELDTLVEITINKNKNGTVIQLKHSNIPSTGSLQAKTKAWTEILNDLSTKLI